MDSAIVIAGFAMVSSMVTPWILSYQRRSEKEQDYKRQDEVATKAAKASEVLLESQQQLVHQNDSTAALLLKSNTKAEASAKVQEAKLDQIHTLVNSNLTAAMQDQLDALKAMLVLLLETVDLKHAASPGAAPSKETVTTIAATKTKIAELSAQLEDRLKQTTFASAKLAVDLGKLNVSK